MGFIVTPQGDLVDPRRRGLQLSTSKQDPYLPQRSLNSSILMPGRMIGECRGDLNDTGYQRCLQNPFIPQPSSHPTALMQGMIGSSFSSGYPITREAITRGDVAVPGGRQSTSTNSSIVQSVIERSIMSPQLFSGLELNGVNFNEDYSCWKK